MESESHKLKMSIWLWLSMMGQLKKRGGGRKESGAFLLGNYGSNKVVEFICFDDLDSECLTGMIEFSASGIVLLSDYCISKNLTVLADVHTHPGKWTNQSETDKKNPMVCISGHIAIIIPKFAQQKLQLLGGVGIFEYLGGSKWKKHKTSILKLTYGY